MAIVSGSRSPQPGGLELAERQLIGALRAHPAGAGIEVRVVGGRAARRYARSIDARWYPSRPGRTPRRAARSADLLHMIGLDLPAPRRDPFVVTIHDLAALRFPDEGRLPSWVPELAARAARVVTASRFAAAEIEGGLGIAPDRIRVIPHGPGHRVAADIEPLGEADLAALGLRDPVVLRLGGYTARKNLALLLEAWPRVRGATGATLALAGPPQPARAAQLAAAPSLDGVAVLDYVPPAVLPRLLRAAAALVSTSTYEGFGLPPLEAMAAGTPVVAARYPFVEEVCADAAVLVDADPRALADGIVAVLQDDALRGRLRAEGRSRAAGFGWERAARELLDVYREVWL